MSLSAALDDTKIQKGKRVAVKLGCQNFSSKAAHHVSIKLYQECVWQAKCISRRERRAVVKRTANIKGLERLPDGVLRGDSARDELAALRAEVLNGTNTVHLPVPANALPTYKSAFISVTHTLVIDVHAEGCQVSPSVAFPVQCSEALPFSQPAAAGDNSLRTVVAVPEGFDGSDAILQAEIVLPPMSVIQATAEALPPPSVGTLLHEMETNLRDLELVRKFLARPEWQSVFSSLSPEDYGKVISKVHSQFDQPEVAMLVAVHMVPSFHCQHVVHSLRNTAKWNRVSLVELLLGHCSDLQANHSKILAELDDWERLSAESLITNALGASAPTQFTL